MSNLLPHHFTYGIRLLGYLETQHDLLYAVCSQLNKTPAEEAVARKDIVTLCDVCAIVLYDKKAMCQENCLDMWQRTPQYAAHLLLCLNLMAVKRLIPYANLSTQKSPDDIEKILTELKTFLNTILTHNATAVLYF